MNVEDLKGRRDARFHFLQILRNGFIQAFNSRYEQVPPKSEQVTE